jgi:hypothetical protein
LQRDAGFGEDAFDLRTHGVFSHTDYSRSAAVHDRHPTAMRPSSRSLFSSPTTACAELLGQNWLKIKNRSYSQAEGRHELLTRTKR